MITEKEFENLINEITDKIKNSTANSKKYNNYKYEHSMNVRFLGLAIYSEYCKNKEIPENIEFEFMIEIAAMLHDISKITVGAKVRNHGSESMRISKEILNKYGFDAHEIYMILTAIEMHTKKTKEDVALMGLLDRIIVDADIISKSLINEPLTYYNNQGELLADLNNIKESFNKKFNNRKNLLLKASKPLAKLKGNEFEHYLKALSQEKKAITNATYENIELSKIFN